MKFRKITLTLVMVALTVSYAFAKKAPKYEQAHQLTPDQEALVQKAIAQEKVLIKNIQERTPLVETYIQDTRPDQLLYEVPVDDQYTLSRVDFGKGFFDKSYAPRSMSRHAFFKGSFSAISELSKALGLDKHFTYNPTGFMQMMFLDPTGFDEQHYVFSYVRREFLGQVRTWVFDVHPKVAGMGRFYGRIWIEDEGGNVVRFNGTYTGPKSDEASKYYFHFDSWRMNVQPGVWLPVAIYVEESNRGDNGKGLGLKAQTHFWGYSLKLPTRDSENVTMKVEDAVDKSDDSQDVSPLQATRDWLMQAQDNVIDRLEISGLVAPLTPNGYETQVLDQIVTNLAVPNNLAFSYPVHCRVLLTDTIEATTVGNTILISKGLLDTLPDEPSIASVVALELAHIALGHHIDTRYAFNDRLLFPDEATFQRIDMNHSDADDASAAKQAMIYLQASMYKDKLADAGLFWEQLAARGKELKALNTPKLGDSMLQPDGQPWMEALAQQAPKINWDDLNQIPALPLGSWLKTDPWDDRVHMLNAKRYAPMNARDKMPLEVTPVYFKLQRYEDANANPPAAPGQPSSGQPAAAPANGGDPTPQSTATGPTQK
ncbi:MAG TPA: hypothetical protein VMU48_08655 [Terracidiphilus sp.]|nr:hypothetical protein [Terracidiphilus sp.]